MRTRSASSIVGTTKSPSPWSRTARANDTPSRPGSAQAHSWRKHLMITTLDSTLLADLAGQVSGPVLGPQDPGYEAARAVHNGLIDRRPAVIVRCRTTADVVAALALRARGRGSRSRCAAAATTSPVAPSTDGGVMIDLAEMKGIDVDPERATATRRGRRDLGRAERRSRRARPGRDRRRDLDDRDRGLHARRRARLADGQVRPRRRQPARPSSS